MDLEARKPTRKRGEGKKKEGKRIKTFARRQAVVCDRCTKTAYVRVCQKPNKTKTASGNATHRTARAMLRKGCSCARGSGCRSADCSVAKRRSRKERREACGGKAKPGACVDRECREANGRERVEQKMSHME